MALSQVKSHSSVKTAEDAMEQEIAGGITDDTANQAAEQALMEAANAMTKDEKDQAPPA